VKGSEELEITGSEVEDFLDSAPRVEHRAYEGIVAPPFRSAPINRGQNGLDFLLLEILYGPRASALERDRENALALFEALWDSAGEVSEEGMKGCQADVTGDGLVSAVLLEVIEEGKHQIWLDIIKVE
jgi:hypothetical protein